MPGTDYEYPQWLQLEVSTTVSVKRLEKVRESRTTEVQALKSVSLVSALGQVAAIIDQGESGKSTLLHPLVDTV